MAPPERASRPVPRTALTANQPYAETPPPGGASFDIGRRTGRQAVVGGLVAGFFGGSAMWATFAPDGGQSPAWAHVVMFVVGAPLALIGLAVLVSLPVVLRKRRVVVGPDGFRWDDPKGTPFQLAWPDLSAITLSTGVNVSTGGRLTLLRVVLEPRDDAVIGRHARMATLLRHGDLGDGGGPRAYWVLPLGDQPKVVQPLSQALSAYSPPGVFRGIRTNWERGVL